ncbi:MAG: hypothetical protein I3273_05695 [Candidatus Moeniiplasma glomeromycotorum]|nr:hypothetical protein [Candidatus Moeniiplasma glomeromycotorum]MCE8168455.1 hypothetical protein [Candidatus Moeniiplasma glomeromycotorum]MCE8169579.1 hypothetical protein [Candidatus Moeniiplasma glomeromycotorum]
MYRVDRNNFYQENKNASIQTPKWVSDFLFELLNPYIKKEGIVLVRSQCIFVMKIEREKKCLKSWKLLLIPPSGIIYFKIKL